MCNVGDDNFEDGALKYMTEKPFANLSSKCNKCRQENAAVVLRGKDSYCRECFLAATTHKFKALLGKHRLICPNDQVLVNYKPGHPSTALLHILRAGLNLNTPKKLRFNPIVVYIENSYWLSVEERKDVLKNIQRQVQEFSFPFYTLSLADYIENFNIKNILHQNIDELNVQHDDKTKLNRVFDKQVSQSLKFDALRLLEKKVLIDIAKYINCPFVFTPELSTDVAMQLLSNVALGRGSHIPLDTGFYDSRHENVSILRPLRLFEIKELAFYNTFHNISPVIVKEQHQNQYSSVQNLMDKFVNDLKINYPATVSTILKTGDKLAISENSIGSATCRICKCPLSQENGEITSEESTKFSRWISSIKPNHVFTPEERYAESLRGFNKQTSLQFCYACDKLKDSFSADFLVKLIN